jgi:hypothetical protein
MAPQVTRAHVMVVYSLSRIAHKPVPADALWAGVPVITLPGQHMAARVASSLVAVHLSRAPAALKRAFVVRNFDEYAGASATRHSRDVLSSSQLKTSALIQCVGTTRLLSRLRAAAATHHPIRF